MELANKNYSTLENYLKDIFIQAFKKLKFDICFAQVQISSQPKYGQFQSNSAMTLAKILKMSPMKIANKIVLHIENNAVFSNINVVTPGFINLTLNDKFLADWANYMLKDERLGCQKTINPLKVIIDFGGPNIAKPLHIGHIRSPLIGDSLQRIYRFYGDHVLSDIHLGDWGTQIGMLIEETRKMYPNLPYFDKKFSGNYPKNSPVTVDELSEIYPRASARCKSDILEMENARLATAELQQGLPGYRALWQHFLTISIIELKKNYADLGVYFDLWKGESDVHPLIKKMVSKLLKQEIAEKNDNAVVISMANNEKIPPLILVKSDGAIMYGTTDLATIFERIEKYKAQKIIYVVDKRQKLHFKQVFYAAKRSGLTKNTELMHVGFGTLNDKNNKPFKTRDGDVMRLSTLIDKAKSYINLREHRELNDKEKSKVIEQIALATVKFADLSNTYSSDYIFDLDKFSRYEGKTGPYLLYSAVRIKSILRKTKPKDIDSLNIAIASNISERNLQLQLTFLPQAIRMAYEKCEPHHLCEYSYKLAVKFNKFYIESPIMNEKNIDLKEARIALCYLTLKHFKLTLDLLGIEIPNKM